MKQCSRCRKLLPKTEFYKAGKDKSPGLLQATCKVCMKLVKREVRLDPVRYRKTLDLRIRARKLNPTKSKLQDRERNLRKCFRISTAEYERLHDLQKGVCAICKKPESAILLGKVKRLAVDHSRENKEVRGLLCSKCNTALGLLNDDVDLLALAADYLLSPIKYPAKYCK